MECQECLRSGKSSTVAPGVETDTEGHASGWWDNNRIWHVYSINVKRTDYVCSNGHKWAKAAVGWSEIRSGMLVSQSSEPPVM